QVDGRRIGTMQRHQALSHLGRAVGQSRGREPMSLSEPCTTFTNADPHHVRSIALRSWRRWTSGVDRRGTNGPDRHGGCTHPVGPLAPALTAASRVYNGRWPRFVIG